MLRTKAQKPLARALARAQHSVVRNSRLFSSSPVSYNAIPIDGKLLAQQRRAALHDEVAQIQAARPQFQPKLVIVQVGERPDSSAYVRMKLKAAHEARIACELRRFPDSVSEDVLLAEVDSLNADPSVHGVLVQLPLPPHMHEPLITDRVAADKDVDGFGTLNIGKLARRGGSPEFVPCTPKGVLELLHHTGVSLRGKHAVVIGRSDIVGNPVAQLLKSADATVTLCHRHTQDLHNIVKEADIVVVAVGIPELVKGDWIKPGAVVVDVGINYVADASKKSGQRLVGDVEHSSVAPVASYLTPVPGGVGPMTVAMLVQNVVDAAKAADQRQAHRRVVARPLQHVKAPVPSDIDISRAHDPRRVRDIAHDMGIADSEIEEYGPHKAKLGLGLLNRLGHRADGRYVLVAGITPTPLGEGKSTTTMGLVQALGAHLGKMAIANVRQPSMGPTFGIKGGAAGGGYSQVIPMDEFNMHLTGDIHAVSAANNLLAAALDTRMFHESTQKSTAGLFRRLVPKRGFTPAMLKRLRKLGIDKTDPATLTDEEKRRFARLDVDPDTITWKRVLDVNDRFVRGVTLGTAPTEKGMTRESGFDISVASECMAVLALASGVHDMRERLGRIVVASSRSGEPITADDLFVGGALAAMMKDAIKPNLMQTVEGTPVLVHAGPFANISIGASSVLADKIALKLTGTEPGEDAESHRGYVVTEAGFDFTMGGERFFNIKCRASGLMPDTVVIVATVRALKLHGGGPDVKPGAPLPEEYTQENVEMVRRGCANLRKQIANARSYGVPVVVAVNKFVSDTDAEIEAIRAEALAAGAFDAVASSHWEHGGRGAVPLAQAVMAATEVADKSQARLLYDSESTSALEKLNVIAREMYGADGVELSELAQTKLDRYTAQGFGNLPLCIAKTQYSLSHDPALKNVPTGFKIPIRDIRASVGAGYLYALVGEIMTIPGLSTYAGFMNVELSENGDIEGLF